MVARIGKFGMSWLSPGMAAADMLVEAGRAEGQGRAALMGGIAQGISAFGENRRRDRARSEDMAFREQSRQDMLAERATDNARADRQASQSEREWKASVLGSLGQRYAGEADLLEQAAAASGDPSLAAQAQGKRAEAQRYLTALDALVTGRGNGIPEMPAPPPPPPLHSMSAPVATAPAAGGGMNAAVDEVVGAAFAGGPGFFGPDGAYPAPSPVAASASAQGPLGITYTGDPVRDVELADLMASRVNALRTQAGGKTWSRMSVERRNMMERAETEAVARKAQASFELDKAKKKMETDEQIRKDREARMATPEEVADAQALGAPAGLKTKAGVSGALAAGRQDKAIDAKAAAAKARAENQKALVDYQKKASMAFADHMAKIKEPAERAKAMQGAIENQQRLVKSLKDEYELLKTLQGKGLVGEDDPDIVGGPNRPSAYERYEAERNVLMDMMKQGAQPAPAPTAAPDPKQQVLEAFRALPPERQTDEEMLRMLQAAGLR